MRFSKTLTIFGILLALAGCGGGGGGSDAASSTQAPVVGSDTSTSTTPPTSSTTPAPSATPVQNTMTVHVDGGANHNVNMIFADVTICEPGSTTKCQTIDHVLVDTGSTGLRLMASVIDPTLNLPLQTVTGGATLTECMQFADGYTWGPVKKADIKLAEEKASSMSVQVIGDTDYLTIPGTCSSYGTGHNSVASLGANGILGVGMFTEDCGSACTYGTSPGLYYACNGATCTQSVAAISQQVANPVPKFASDNNGVVITLPSVPLGGAKSVTGTMTFGIGTQSNNAIGSASVLRANASNGYITTTYNGKTYNKSFIDSGSNGFFFRDASLNQCTSTFYCVPTQTLGTSNQGLDPLTKAVSFTLENADQMFSNNPTNEVFSTLGGDFSMTSSFDWGLPFFLGRTVFTAIEGKSTPGGTGPYFAF